MDNVRLFCSWPWPSSACFCTRLGRPITARRLARPHPRNPCKWPATGVDTPVAPDRADIDAAAPSVPAVGGATEGGSSRLVKVHTDTFDMVIDTAAGRSSMPGW